jgi:N-acetylglucosaminyl-diphospho-decaprenol L-rhamnosyltransferase
LSTDAETESTPDAAPQWAAVIVNYEAGSLLAACVRSVVADQSAGAPDVVVVDNGSRDGSIATLATAFPSVRVVDMEVNLGYGAAANRGIAATAAPVVAVCNADIEVQPGTAAAMLARFDREPDLAALGPTILNPDGSQYPSARSVPSTADALGHALFGAIHPRNAFTRRYRQLDVDPSRPRDVEWLSGAAMWLRRSAIDSVGGWDEQYFMYGEDVDLCWRLRRLGWRVSYEPQGTVTHVQGVSTDHHPYRMIVRHHRSVYRFATKRWHGAKRALLVPTAVLLTVRGAFAIVARALGGRHGRSRGKQ